MSWTCTQNGIFLNSSSCTGVSPVYLCITIKCLSKLHGWPFRIFSTFERLSNTNSTILLPWFLILNPLVVLHNCLNVQATPSIWRKHVVKNFAAIENSPLLWSSGRIKPFYSFFDNDILFYLLVSYSIVPY